MRLTLRTLLAYLDDVLEPSETKLMGQKIQESPVAGVLVSRIREVMRRRRLKAPDVSGANMGIDPNIVAQYLDNTLPPEQVADVERVLLSSDELLAEVAACHQVLTLDLGEASEVSQASRERLYALGPVAPADQLHVDEPPPSATISSDGTVISSTTTKGAASSMHAFAGLHEPTHEIPDYLRPTPWSQRALPTAMIALLILVCAGLLISDPGFLTGLREAKRELAKSSRETAANSGTNSDETTTSPADDNTVKHPELAGNIASPKPATAVKPATTAPATRIPVDLDPPPPQDEPDPSSTSKPKATTPTPAGETKPHDDQPADAVAVAATKPKAVVPIPPEPGPPAPAAVPAALVQYTSNDGVVLRFDETQRHWYMTPHRSVLKTGELLACLEPFEAGVDIDQGALRATIIGDSLVQLLGPSDVAKTGLDLRRGRVILQGSRREAQKSVSLAIVVGQDAWKLELLTPDTVCAIEILPREPSRFEKPHDQNWYVGTLYVLAGSAKWTSSLGQTQEVGDRTGLTIAPEREAAPAKPAPISFPTAPDWTDAAKRKGAPLRSFAQVFEKKFELDQPAEQTMQALISDRNSRVSELAVKALALTDSYSALVQALAECAYEEGRFAARDGLRLWVPMNPDHGLLLKKELEMRHPPAEADAVYRMLWGFTREDGKDKLTSLQFTTWMRSSHVEIRELADYWVERLLARKTEYRATGVASQRETYVKRLEKMIEEDGALIKGE